MVDLKDLQGISDDAVKELNQKMLLYFKENNWEYKEVEEYFYGLELSQKVSFITMAEVNNYFIAASSRLPFVIRKRHEKKVIEMINMLNTRILCGHFSFDEFTGEVYYRYVADHVGEEVNFHFFNNIFKNAAVYMRQYYPCFVGLVEQNLSPKKALELKE